MVFSWRLSDSKSLLVSRILLGILANLCNVVVGMVSTHPLISNSVFPLTKSLGTILSTSVVIGITVTFMFHKIFSSLACSKFYYNYYYTPYKFFTPALADGLSLESKWPQVSSGLQYSFSIIIITIIINFLLDFYFNTYCPVSVSLIGH